MRRIPRRARVYPGVHPVTGHAAAGWLVAAAVCGLLVACAAPTLPEARAALDRHVAACSERHDYAPDRVQDAGPHEILPGERAWRECVYAGIETLVVPHTGMPGLYRSLIREDRHMTDAVEAGRLTRSERRRQLDALILAIEEGEQAWAEARASRALENARAFENQQRQVNEQDALFRRSALTPLGR